MFLRRCPFLDGHNDALTCVWIFCSLLCTFHFEKIVVPLIQCALPLVTCRFFRSPHWSQRVLRLSLCVSPCVHYACRFSRFGWNCWTCRGASCTCAHELVLLLLPLTKSKVFHNFLFCILPILSIMLAGHGRVRYPCCPCLCASAFGAHPAVGQKSCAESSWNDLGVTSAR